MNTFHSSPSSELAVVTCWRFSMKKGPEWIVVKHDHHYRSVSILPLRPLPDAFCREGIVHPWYFHSIKIEIFNDAIQYYIVHVNVFTVIHMATFTIFDKKKTLTVELSLAALFEQSRLQPSRKRLSQDLTISDQCLSDYQPSPISEFVIFGTPPHYFGL